MYGVIVRILAKRAFDDLREGDAEFAAALMADDAHFRFPGRSPFAADHRSADDIRRWLRRFAHFHPRFDIHDVIAAGPPWAIRACIHFSDVIGGPDDPDPYVNEGVCLFRMRFGRVVEQRVFLDTQAVADFFGTETPDEFFVDLADTD